MSSRNRLQIVRKYAVDVSGINALVTHRRVRNLTITVKREGTVFVTAPARASLRDVEHAISARHEWIRRAQARFAQQPRPRPVEFANGESHRFQGRDVELRVIARPGRTAVRLVGDTLELHASPSSTTDERRAAIERWYREQLLAAVPGIIEPWAEKMKVLPLEWRIRRMRTRWGTCNTRDRRIWLNLQLAMVSPGSLEYVVVHELAHLLEASHNSRFRSLMDQFLPDWRARRSVLNSEGRAWQLREG